MVSTTSSVRPRQFMRAPMVRESRQEWPVRRTVRAPHVPKAVTIRMAPAHSHAEALSPSRPKLVRSLSGRRRGAAAAVRRRLRAGRWSGPRPASRGGRSSEDEGAEQGVDADLIGGQGGQTGATEEQGQDEAVAWLGGTAHPERHQRAHHIEHRQEERGRRGGRRKGVEGRAAAGDGDHHGQQTPGGDIVDGGAGDRQGGERGAGQSAVGEDPGQHGKRRDAHGHGYEQHERRAPDALGGQRAIHRQGQQGTTHGGQRDTHLADGESGAAVAVQRCEVEFRADQEHERQQAELRRGRAPHRLRSPPARAGHSSDMAENSSYISGQKTERPDSSCVSAPGSAQY